MTGRNRAFSAIIKESKIVMVHIIDGEKNFWTLPSGGVMEGESFEETAIREAQEEVNLAVTIIRNLFNREYEEGTEYCYLAEVTNDSDLSLGYDPEYDLGCQVQVYL
jgi:8-oxo-dGTP diphosphatase